MIRIEINGVVQGVGFRPFVYKLAKGLNLLGYVLNSSDGVEIEAEGNGSVIHEFARRIREEIPPAAHIESFHMVGLPDAGYKDFTIRQSRSGNGLTFISPDLAICQDCLSELKDPEDYRYDYAFINCTNCGPRYSIISKTPYDRPFTSMNKFEMCVYCVKEYTEPLNRRFHAQPIACSKCGPDLKFYDNNLLELKGSPISNCLAMLKKGKIIGIKGIGGFHIACDASNEKAVQELRLRKKRPHKPFAVMCSADDVRKIALYSTDLMEILTSPAAPIILLPKLAGSMIAKSVAPSNPNLGILIPYAPHHHQIFSKSELFLVMTSGNNNDEPIAREAEELRSLCDFFLTHNRPILNRNDDSVIMPSVIENVMIRRSRGYIPSPLSLPFDTIPTLGTGAELKIAFALTNKRACYISPYIGNNNSKATEDFYLETLRKYQDWFGIKPELVACDLHPDYLTTRFAENLQIPVIKIQHHHSHIAAVMAENMLDETVLGISYDGTGYGEDGAIWGGEIFRADYSDFSRQYHLNYMPLPGGDAATMHPVRIAYAYLLQAGEDVEFLSGISEIEKKVIRQQLNNNFNIYQTSSMGRLFDCVAALLGLFPEVTFEAQSAMALEYLCKNCLPTDCLPYAYEIGEGKIDIIPLIRDVRMDILRGTAKELIALRFHKTVIAFTVEAIIRTARDTGLNKVVLSGGVMQNMVLFEGLTDDLRRNNFTVFYSSKLPVNDGAVSIGQAIIANRMIKKKRE